jgi:RNA polymerase sigma-70 factor (ECF subfamily)
MEKGEGILMGINQLNEIDSLYREYKNFLFGLAYRMMGTVSDAEDVVQEIYLNLHQFDLSQIRDRKSFLAKVTVNHCLNQLKSAQKKREIYVGTWLPEPLLLDVEQENPEETFLQRETLTYALLTLLQQLNPIERAVFLLREVFGFQYTEIAEIIGKTEMNCRKINSRGKAKIHVEGQPITEPQNNEAFIFLFIKAIHSGKIDDFVQLLSKDAVAYADGGGKVKASVNTIVTRERIGQYLTDIVSRLSQVATLSFTPIQMNGETGLAISLRDKLWGILALKVSNNHVQNLYIIVNPDKLHHAEKILTNISKKP